MISKNTGPSFGDLKGDNSANGSVPAEKSKIDSWGSSHALNWFAGFRLQTKPYNCLAVNARNYDYYEQDSLDRIDNTPDAVFVWGVGDRNEVLTSRMQTGSKLVDNEFLRHNILDGEWTYGQLYFNDLLKASGIVNPLKALTEREHVYYISGSERSNLILKYIQEHYYPDCSVEQVGTIEDIPVWKFNK